MCNEFERKKKICLKIDAEENQENVKKNKETKQFSVS